MGNNKHYKENEGIKEMGSDNEQLMLSVLVMAYKRKEFIKEALISVLNQTIPRESYEIICVIGFKDDDFSNFLQKNGIREIFCDGKLGERLVTAIKASSGDIVVFLDDDDKFRKDKLECVLQLFEKKKCIYYHNNVELIDKTSHLIQQPINPYDMQITHSFVWNPFHGYRKIIKYRGDFNLSSIAVSKFDIAKYTFVLNRIEAGPDSIIFYLLLQNKKSFFFDTNKTTLYRIHDSETNTLTGTRINNTDVPKRFYNSRLTCYQELTNIKVKRIFRGYFLESMLGAYIAGNNSLKPNVKEFIDFFVIGITRPSAFYLRLLFATLLYGHFPSFVRSTRQKRIANKYGAMK